MKASFDEMDLGTRLDEMGLRDVGYFEGPALDRLIGWTKGYGDRKVEGLYVRLHDGVDLVGVDLTSSGSLDHGFLARLEQSMVPWKGSDEGANAIMDWTRINRGPELSPVYLADDSDRSWAIAVNPIANTVALVLRHFDEQIVTSRGRPFNKFSIDGIVPQGDNLTEAAQLLGKIRAHNDDLVAAAFREFHDHNTVGLVERRFVARHETPVPGRYWIEYEVTGMGSAADESAAEELVTSIRAAMQFAVAREVDGWGDAVKIEGVEPAFEGGDPFAA